MGSSGGSAGSSRLFLACACEAEAWVGWEMGKVQQERARSQRMHGCMLACITRASLGQCAGHVLCSAAPCSGVLPRLPTTDGSLEAPFADALDDADHAATLRRARLPHHAEQDQTGHDKLVPLSLYCHGQMVELTVLQIISTTQVDDPMTLLLGSMLAMSLQQPLWLLHFCATCGHCTGDGQTGRKPGARRGTVPLGGMRGVSGRGAACRPAQGAAATLSPFC